MKKKHNYVECQYCTWRLRDQPDFDWESSPCPKCANTRQVIDPKELLCNLCAGSVCPLGTHNEQYPHGLFEAKIQGGYDSYHLFDMTEYTFSFCELCLRKLFNQCKIPPHVQDGSIDGVDYSHDKKLYEYRLWCDNGGHHQAYLDRKCNFEKDCPNQAKYTQLISGDFTENSSCEEHKSQFQYGNSVMVKFIPNNLKVFL